MPAVSPLGPDQLRTSCDPSSLGFVTTDELDTREAVVGQQRAVEALQLGMSMRHRGFNLFVLGTTGSGRGALTRTFVEARAARERVPDEFCYVHNFAEPRRPRTLRLPPGQAIRLRDHLERVIEELRVAIPAVFESQGYRERRDAVEQEFEQRYEREIEAITTDARGQGVAVMHTPTGFALAPLREGKPLGPEEREKLSPEEQARLAKVAEQVQERLYETLKRVPLVQREQRERIRRLDQEVTRATVGEVLGQARRAFGELPAVLEHLDAVEHDLIEHTSHGIRADAETRVQRATLAELVEAGGSSELSVLRRYRVNVLVDHHLQQGAPVVFLEHPTTANLVGKVEHQSQFGVLITDFNLIRRGALHAANGGYLVIDARRLLMQPVAYEQLKRALRAGEIRIESVAEALDLTQTVSLEPEPIPFRGKVILLGERLLYHRLCELDPEFEELFKIAAEVEPDIPRSEESSRRYAGLLARVIRTDGLLPMDAPAVARVIDQAARLSGDANKLSMQVRRLFDIVRESSHWAEQAGRAVVSRDDVERAIAQHAHRHGWLRERFHEAFTERALHVETRGRAVGQINGLSVSRLGQVQFGFPCRLTARVRLGKGEVIAIDREVQMGGPIHNKGVLILSSFLASRYRPERPSSLHATLVFEQTYGLVEGDSASLAELLVLISAIAELPLGQGVAVTGSVDQHGRVQAVGGINEKIEGFFETCKAGQLDGSQGVVIPGSNRRHLMLEPEVVHRVADGGFHVWTVETVDEAIQLVFGQPAGVRGADGKYPRDSVNGRVEQRLDDLFEAALAAMRAVRTASEATGVETEPASS